MPLLWIQISCKTQRTLLLIDADQKEAMTALWSWYLVLPWKAVMFNWYAFFPFINNGNPFNSWDISVWTIIHTGFKQNPRLFLVQFLAFRDHHSRSSFHLASKPSNYKLNGFCIHRSPGIPAQGWLIQTWSVDNPPLLLRYGHSKWIPWLAKCIWNQIADVLNIIIAHSYVHIKSVWIV